MDSTLINIECIDEIAQAVGRKAEVAAITEAAMRGQVQDYRLSLHRRLALLRGVPLSALEQVYAQHLQFNPGSRSLCRGLPRSRIEDAVDFGRLHLLQRTRAPAAEAGLCPRQ
jgi:phosphoserine phosphatase